LENQNSFGVWNQVSLVLCQHVCFAMTVSISTNSLALSSIALL